VKFILITCILLFSILFILDLVRFLWLVKKGLVLAKNAVRYERVVPNAEMNILVVGDSTAVGTGAETPELSTAGRLGAMYPTANIHNLSVNGIKVHGLLKILDGVDPKKHFSIILVQIGANDIMRFTSMNDIKRDITKVVAKLAPQADRLIVLHSGDVGQSKLFPIYAKPILSRRSFEVREIYKNIASYYNAHYVDLIDAPARKLFLDNPATYNAADFLHPDGAGYNLWFDEIKKVLPH
jgi:lysophospholipase L1-like esterase